MLAHLQMTHGAANASLRNPDVFAALAACRDAGLIEPRDHDEVVEAYTFLRQALNRMQLFDGKPSNELPAGDGLETFARRMGYKAGPVAAREFADELQWHREAARRAFERYVS
jgi:glutamate-ammonia-ligase adenylyltransferase